MANADGSVIIRARVDVAKADKDLAKLKASIEDTEREIEEMSQERYKAEQAGVFSAAELDAEQAKLAEMKKQLEEMRQIAKDVTVSPSTREEAKAQIPLQKQEIADQQTRVSLLRAEYNKIENSVSRYDEKIAKATRKLERQQEEAGDLAKQINSVSRASLKMEQAQERAQKSMRKFGLRLREVIRSALIFTLITQSLAKFRDWMGKVLKTNTDAQQSFARLKGALLTAAQPLVELLVPAAIMLADALTRILTVVAQVTSALAGKTVEESKDAADALNKETEALEGVGEAANDAEKALAGFDEINKLSGSEQNNSDAISPNFNFGEGLSEESESLARWIAVIGSGLATWKISSGVLDWFNALAGGKFNSIGKVAGGVTSIATGLVLAMSNASAIRAGEYDQASAQSAINSAASGILVGLGLVLFGVSAWAIPIAIVVSLILTDLSVNAEQYVRITQDGLKMVKALFTNDSEMFWDSATDGLLTWLKTDSWAQKLGKAIFGEDTWKKAESYFELNSIKDMFGTYVTNLIDTLELAWESEEIGLIEKVGLTAAGMGSAFELGLADAYSGVKKWLEDKVGFPIIDYLENSLKEKWRDTWAGIGDSMKTELINAINWAIEKINSAIGGINNIFGTNIAIIPQINLPASSIASGQQTPVGSAFATATHKQGVAGMIANSSGKGSGSESTTVVLEVDKRELGRVVYNSSQTEVKRFGSSLLEVAVK